MPNAVRDVFFHRSGMETTQRCPRLGYLEYNYLETGMNVDPRQIWFDIGIAVHYGLGILMEGGEGQEAVDRALEYYDNESQQTEEDLGVQWHEQRMLIEGLLWAFVYYALPSFRLLYDVLFVERQCLKVRWVVVEENGTKLLRRVKVHDIARPDVIVRVKLTKELCIVNWKTINDLTDERKENHAHGLQGFREHYFGEGYIRNLKVALQEELQLIGANAPSMTIAEMQRNLKALQAMIATAEEVGEDPQIDYTQFVYLVKGKRVKEATLQRLGEEGEEGYIEVWDGSMGKKSQWRQDSILVYPWVRQGSARPEVERDEKNHKKVNYFPPISWAWRYQKPGAVSFNVLGKALYKRELMGLGVVSKDYVKALSESRIFPNTIRPDLPSPLSKVIVFDSPVYRKALMMESLHRQLEAQQVAHVLRLVQIEGLRGDELRSKAETLFPQYLHSCRVPIKCQMWGFCHEGKELDYESIPQGFVKRVPHHRAELEAFQAMERGEEVEPEYEVVYHKRPVPYEVPNDSPLLMATSELLPDDSPARYWVDDGIGAITYPDVLEEEN